MKTGTTSLQMAARGRRDVLLEHGVRYPGSAVNHRRELGALMGWSVNTWNRAGRLHPDLLDVDKPGVPPRKDWDRLMTEVEADHERRIFLTHEFVSQADDEVAQRLVSAIGERIHVCLTLRAPGQIVPSLWAQGMRDDAQTEPFEDWLTRFFGRDAEHPISGRYQRAYDQSDLVERWARLVGPENVTVIVVDKSNPGLLTGSFEEMLGLPTGTLDWKRTNESLTAIDAELFRHVNAEITERGASWSTFHNLVREGTMRLGPERRAPLPGEPRVVLPPWAAEITDQDGRRFADEIARSQVRVVGDLENLATPARRAQWEPVQDVPIEIAANAVSGAILAGQKARATLKKQIRAQSDELEQLRARLAERNAELARMRTERNDHAEQHNSAAQASGSHQPSPAEQLMHTARERTAQLRRRAAQRLWPGAVDRSGEPQ